ncbi:hypothetical protein EF888_11040 [Silicimonas algicola]|uniref:Uncharacterized protein n=1 Tax=Silicimonas algicola TaxID=1826607 RepID=A0A316FW10_9RHOB|nr:hypothetical protein [Silicimonas algicola]AZQ67619.1 hypothetical protein EF888_11040 [Silicimonas algicola]PWK52778.1 hypothetical protein C8D95_11555 [Silicimonas algicola]
MNNSHRQSLSVLAAGAVVMILSSTASVAESQLEAGLLRIDGRIVLGTGPSRRIEFDTNEQTAAAARAIAISAIAKNPERALATDEAALFALSILPPNAQRDFLAEHYPGAHDSIKSRIERDPFSFGTAMNRVVSNPFVREDMAKAAREFIVNFASANPVDNLDVRVFCPVKIREYDLGRGYFPIEDGGGGYGCSNHPVPVYGLISPTLSETYRNFPTTIAMDRDDARDLYEQVIEWPPFLTIDGTVRTGWGTDFQNRPQLNIRIIGGSPYHLVNPEEPEKVLFTLADAPADMKDVLSADDMTELLNSAQTVTIGETAPHTLFPAGAGLGRLYYRRPTYPVGTLGRLGFIDKLPETPTNAELAEALGVPTTHLVDATPAKQLAPGIDRLLFVFPAPATDYAVVLPASSSISGQPFIRVQLQIGTAWKFEHDGQSVLVLSARPLGADAVNHNDHPKEAMVLRPNPESLTEIFRAPEPEPVKPPTDLSNADIMGLRLGMEIAEAEQLARTEIDVGWSGTLSSARMTNPKPMQDFMVLIDKDRWKRVSLYWSPEETGRLAGIARLIAVPIAGQDVAKVKEDLVQLLVEKYGEPDYVKGFPERPKMVWTGDLGVNFRQLDAKDLLELEPLHPDSTCYVTFFLGSIGVGFRSEGPELDSRTAMFLPIHGPYLKVATLVSQEPPPDFYNRCGPTLVAEIHSDAEHAFLRYGLVDMGRYKMPEPPEVSVTKPKL